MVSTLERIDGLWCRGPRPKDLQRTVDAEQPRGGVMRRGTHENCWSLGRDRFPLFHLRFSNIRWSHKPLVPIITGSLYGQM